MVLIDVFLHLDKYLQTWTLLYGTWIYLLVFLVVYCETGLVVTPFLPGDSLLFALGALTALEGSPLSIFKLSIVLIAAAFLGDNTNYFLGKFLGPRLFKGEKNRLFNRQHLEDTQKFYLKYGRLAVIFARFIPIVRTFAPFVAGLGKMRYLNFLSFSLVASLLWTQIFLWAGAFFGDVPAVKHDFQLVIIGVIAVSLLPLLLGWLRQRTVKSQL